MQPQRARLIATESAVVVRQTLTLMLAGQPKLTSQSDLCVKVWAG